MHDLYRVIRHEQSYNQIDTELHLLELGYEIHLKCLGFVKMAVFMTLSFIDCTSIAAKHVFSQQLMKQLNVFVSVDVQMFLLPT